MKKADAWLWGLVVVLVAAIGITIAYKQLSRPSVLPHVTVELAQGCDLHATACSVVFPHLGPVTLSITPQPIPVVQPLRVVVETPIVGIQGVDVDFSGVDMNMGKNVFRLEPVSAGRYEGAAMLPVCVRSRMKWEAKVYIAREEAVLVAPFRFDTVSSR